MLNGVRNSPTTMVRWEFATKSSCRYSTLENVRACHGPDVPFSRKMTSSDVARDSMIQRSPMGTATTGAMAGWKQVAPPVVVFRYCTPPEMMGVSVWEHRITALDNSSSRRDKNLTNIVSSIAKKFMRAGHLAPAVPAHADGNSVERASTMRC